MLTLVARECAGLTGLGLVAPSKSLSAEHLSRQIACHPTFRNYGHSVHENIFHPPRKLIGPLEGSHVANSSRIKYHQIRPHTQLQHATIRQTHPLRRESAELTHGIFQGECVLLAHVFAQDTRKSAIGAGMRMLATE